MTVIRTLFLLQCCLAWLYHLIDARLVASWFCNSRIFAKIAVFVNQ